METGIPNPEGQLGPPQVFTTSEIQDITEYPPGK
jgi:hypothetical protein